MENLGNLYLIERNNREIEHIKKTTKEKKQIDKLIQSNKILNNLINNKECKKENTNTPYALFIQGDSGKHIKSGEASENPKHKEEHNP